jgi:hypothetical protein
LIQEKTVTVAGHSSQSLSICINKLPYTVTLPSGFSPNTFTIAKTVAGTYSSQFTSNTTVNCTTPQTLTNTHSVNFTILNPPVVAIKDYYLCKGDSIVICNKAYFANVKDTIITVTCLASNTLLCDSIFKFRIKSSKIPIPGTAFSGNIQNPKVNQIVKYSSISNITATTSTTWSIKPASAGIILSSSKDSCSVQWLTVGIHKVCNIRKRLCDSTQNCISVTVSSVNNPFGYVGAYTCGKTTPYTYSAFIYIVGGKAPYFVGNTIVKTNVYKTPFYPSGQAFSITFVDSNGKSFTVTGAKTCTSGSGRLEVMDTDPVINEDFENDLPSIEINNFTIVNTSLTWRIENVTIYNLQGQRLCGFEMTENLDLQACMSQYSSSIYIIKTAMISERGEKRIVVKKLFR